MKDEPGLQRHSQQPSAMASVPDKIISSKGSSYAKVKSETNIDCWAQELKTIQSVWNAAAKTRNSWVREFGWDPVTLATSPPFPVAWETRVRTSAPLLSLFRGWPCSTCHSLQQLIYGKLYSTPCTHLSSDLFPAKKFFRSLNGSHWDLHHTQRWKLPGVSMLTTQLRKKRKATPVCYLQVVL